MQAVPAQRWPVGAHPPRADLPCCGSTSAQSSPGLDSGDPTGTGDGGAALMRLFLAGVCVDSSFSLD